MDDEVVDWLRLAQYRVKSGNLKVEAKILEKFVASESFLRYPLICLLYYLII